MLFVGGYYIKTATTNGRLFLSMMS